MSRSKSASGAVKLRQKPLSNGSRSLYLDIYYEGSRTYEFLKLYLVGDPRTDPETLRIAEAVRAERELRIKAGRYKVRRKSMDRGSFMEYMELRSEGRTNAWRNALLHLRLMRPGGIAFGDVTPRFVEDWKSYLGREVDGVRRLSQNTIRAYYDAVSMAARMAEEEDLIVSNPFRLDRSKPKRSRTVVEYLTIEDLRLLESVESPCPHVRCAFLFSCYTGLRRSDVISVQASDVRGDHLALRQKKTGEAVYIPLSQQALEIIDEASKIGGIGDHHYLFTLPSEVTTNNRLRTWALMAGLKKYIHFHVARHTFATLALTNGADLYTVSKLLGHTSIATTQIYAQVVNQLKRTAVDALPKLKA